MKKYSDDQIDAMVKRVMAHINKYEIQAVANELGITPTNLRNKIRRGTVWKDVARWANDRGVSQEWAVEGIETSRNLTIANPGPGPPDLDARAFNDLHTLLAMGGPLAQCARDCLSNLVSAAGKIQKGQPHENQTEARVMPLEPDPSTDEDASLAPAAGGTHGHAAGRTRV